MLTDLKIKKLKPNPTKTEKVTDGGGLRVWVYPSGRKSFKIKYYYQGKEQTDTVGQYPAVTLAEARARREEIKSLLQKGLNPAQEKKRVKQQAIDESQNTFGSVADSYLEKLHQHRPPRAPATIKKNKAFIEEAKREIGSMPIANVNTRAIARLIEKRIESGHLETARRLRTVIGSVFRHALSKGIVETDPTLALRGLVPNFEVKHMAAILNMDDIGDLLIAIDNDTGHQTTKIALRLIILFALRPVELRGAKWDEFDFDKKQFSLPKERMKSRKPHVVMLSDEAIKLLMELKKLTGWSDYLFPSNGRKHAFMSENTMNQALRRMGYGGDEVSAHGFRSTFTTNANESCLWNPDAIERYCARGDKNAIRGIYNRGGYLEERVKIARWWSNEVFQAYNRRKTRKL